MLGPRPALPAATITRRFPAPHTLANPFSRRTFLRTVFLRTQPFRIPPRRGLLRAAYPRRELLRAAYPRRELLGAANLRRAFLRAALWHPSPVPRTPVGRLPAPRTLAWRALANANEIRNVDADRYADDAETNPPVRGKVLLGDKERPQHLHDGGEVLEHADRR